MYNIHSLVFVTQYSTQADQYYRFIHPNTLVKTDPVPAHSAKLFQGSLFFFWLFASLPAECAAVEVQPEGRLTCRPYRKGQRTHTRTRGLLALKAAVVLHMQGGATQVQWL